MKRQSDPQVSAASRLVALCTTAESGKAAKRKAGKPTLLSRKPPYCGHAFQRLAMP